MTCFKPQVSKVFRSFLNYMPTKQHHMKWYGGSIKEGERVTKRRECGMPQKLK